MATLPDWMISAGGGCASVGINPWDSPISAAQAQMRYEQRCRQEQMMRQQQLDMQRQTENLLNQYGGGDGQWRAEYSSALLNPSTSISPSCSESPSCSPSPSPSAPPEEDLSIEEFTRERKDRIIMVLHQFLNDYHKERSQKAMAKGIAVFLSFLGLAVLLNFGRILQIVEVAIKCVK